MGNSTVSHDPKTIKSLRHDIIVYGIFEEARWMIYFESLNGFDEGMALQFAQNLMVDYSKVEILMIESLE